MSKVNPGKRFEAKLMSSMQEAGIYAMRIPDKVYWTGKRMVSEETPADFIASFVQAENGELHQFLIEAKACAKHRLPYDNLKPHQLAALMEYDDLHENSHGYVAVNYYDGVSLSRMDVCFMVPIGVWVEHSNGDMKSLSHEECLEDDRIIMCQKVKGGVYDMGKWKETLR